MGRTINFGINGQYIEEADVVVQNNLVSSYKTAFPENIDSHQWEEFVSFLESFLLSQEAKILEAKNYEKLEIELTEAKKKKHSSGWQNFRDFLSDAANLTIVLPPIVSFIDANSNQVAQWIQHLFRCI